jgi:hypothetical protein
MNGIKQALLVAGSVAALTIVALTAYFLFAYPSLISLIAFFVIVPVFLILGLGFLGIARNSTSQKGNLR